MIETILSREHSLTKNIILLWVHVRPKRKIQLYFLFFLSLALSFFELAGIGSVYALLSVLVDPAGVKALFDANLTGRGCSVCWPVSRFLIDNIVSIFIGITVTSILMRLIWLRTSATISFQLGADIGVKIYGDSLRRPYLYHLEKNTSEIIDGISSKGVEISSNVVLPILVLINSVIVAIFVLGAMLFVNFKIFIFIVIAGGGIYGAIVYFTKNSLYKNSLIVATETQMVLKSLQEGLGGIRDVLIDGTQNFYVDSYKNSLLKVSQARAKNQFIASSPRYIIEGLVLVSAASIFLSFGLNGQSLQSLVPIIGAYAFGAQRFLPVLQQIYSSWSTIKSSEASLQDVIRLLGSKINVDKLEGTTLEFKDRIELELVSFRYPGREELVLNEASVIISKGDKVGVIGQTGMGKSTFLDLFMGLLMPVSGMFRVDGRDVSSAVQIKSWQKNIAHVPQSIYLADSSIMENIAFGLPIESIDVGRVIECAKIAQIHDVIESFPLKYKTLVGERGARLSGGQKQRVGIARALYKNVSVLILDEATNALDVETEKLVLQGIYESLHDITVLIVTHRPETLYWCNKIYKIDNRKISKNIYGAIENGKVK